MPFIFSHLCELLQELEDHRTRAPPLSSSDLKDRSHKAVERWFRRHRSRIDASDVSGTAFFSAFFPERRTDRVYNLRQKNLAKLLGRVLGVSLERRKTLEAWCKPGGGDLATCVEMVQRQAEMHKPLAGNEVTLEEIDGACAALAARCRFSSPAVRQSTVRELQEDPNQLLRPLFHRLCSRDAKWLTRLLLKDYAPVVIPEHLVLTQYHFLLPELLKIQSTFDAAISLLRGPADTTMLLHPSNEGGKQRLRHAIMQKIMPKVGVKVGRPYFFKARSIKHCMDMVGRQRMSLERKYDGEYCQIHVDLARQNDWLQIFSKSGKDSTADRKGIRETIRKCLRINSMGRRFSGKCILEGEMVVFSDKDNKILEFHKLRKHIARSGTYLGTEMDSQPHSYEHLMIVLFDVLLVDDSPTLTKHYNERKKVLEDLVHEIPGRAILASRQAICFKSPDAAANLRSAFARGITARWEGFVLKPIDQPYFGAGAQGSSQTRHWIKLKKDYITGLGDTADFAVVGAGFSGASRGAAYKILSWTHFHIGCLENKEQVTRFGATPRWKVIQSVKEGIHLSDLKRLNQLGKFEALDLDDGQVRWPEFEVRIDISHDDCQMDVIFRRPFVFDLTGGGYVKPPGKNFYTLRWPRVSKIHWDRSWTETVGFEELQQMARDAVNAPEDAAASQEAAWIEKLEAADMGSRRLAAMMADSSYQAAKAARREEDCGGSRPNSLCSELGTPPSSHVSVHSDREEEESDPSAELVVSPTKNAAASDARPGRGSGARRRPPLLTPPASSQLLPDEQQTRHENEHPSDGGVFFPRPPSKSSAAAAAPWTNAKASPRKRKAVDGVGNNDPTSSSPQAKRKRIGTASSSQHVLPSSSPSFSSSSAREDEQSTPPLMTSLSNLPLTDITNQKYPPPPRRPSTSTTSPTKKPSSADLRIGAQQQPFSSPVRGSRRGIFGPDLMDEGGVAPSSCSSPARQHPTTRAIHEEDTIIPTTPLLLLPRLTISSITTSLRQSCHHDRPHTCPLRNALVLLSPCIAYTPYITENLLSLHGRTRWTSLSPPAHDSSSSSSTPSTTTTPTMIPHTHQIIALVESHRIVQTRLFLTQLRRGVIPPLRDSNPTSPTTTSSSSGERRNGSGSGTDRDRDCERQSRNKVLVYDWRVLEAWTRREGESRAGAGAGAGPGGGMDGDDDDDDEQENRIWKRAFVCAI